MIRSGVRVLVLRRVCAVRPGDHAVDQVVAAFLPADLGRRLRPAGPCREPRRPPSPRSCRHRSRPARRTCSPTCAAAASSARLKMPAVTWYPPYGAVIAGPDHLGAAWPASISPSAPVVAISQSVSMWVMRHPVRRRLPDASRISVAGKTSSRLSGARSTARRADRSRRATVDGASAGSALCPRRSSAMMKKPTQPADAEHDQRAQAAHEQLQRALRFVRRPALGAGRGSAPGAGRRPRRCGAAGRSERASTVCRTRRARPAGGRAVGGAGGEP